MEIVDPFFLIFVNSAPEKELANLGQTLAFLSVDLEQGVKCGKSWEITSRSMASNPRTWTAAKWWRPE